MSKREIIEYQPNSQRTIIAKIDFSDIFALSGVRPPLSRDVIGLALRAQFVPRDDTAYPLVFAVILRLEKIERGVDHIAGAGVDSMAWSLRVWPARARWLVPALELETKQKIPFGFLEKMKTMLDELAKKITMYKGTTIVGWGNLFLTDKGEIQTYSDFFWSSGFSPFRNDGMTIPERFSDWMDAAEAWMENYFGHPRLDPWEDSVMIPLIEAIIDKGIGAVANSLVQKIERIRPVRVSLRRNGHILPQSGLTNIIQALPNWPDRRKMMTIFIDRPDLFSENE